MRSFLVFFYISCVVFDIEKPYPISSVTVDVSISLNNKKSKSSQKKKKLHKTESLGVYRNISFDFIPFFEIKGLFF